MEMVEIQRENRQGYRWKCLTAEHLFNVKQHSGKIMVEISCGGSYLQIRADDQQHNTNQSRISFVWVFDGWYKLVFHIQLMCTCNISVVLIQGNKWMDVQMENVHTL